MSAAGLERIFEDDVDGTASIQSVPLDLNNDIFANSIVFSFCNEDLSSPTHRE
jgi:hypothetical protein